MRFDEAIDILLNSNEYHHAKGDMPHSAATLEAFNTAIEALKMQGLVCNNCHYWNSDLKYCMHFSTFMDSDDYCSDHVKRYEGTGGDEK